MSNGVLIVAEKPSIVRALVDVLAPDSHTKVRFWESVFEQTRFDVVAVLVSKRPGHSQYNWVFEFRMKIGGRVCEVALTSVMGHVMNYDFPTPYNKW
jgi:DNA topoisomerase IA